MQFDDEDLSSGPDVRRKISQIALRTHSRLSRLRKALESAAMVDQGTSADRLARERIQKQLEGETANSESLSRQLEEMRQKYVVLMENFGRIKREAEKKLDSLVKENEALREDQKIGKELMVSAVKELEELKAAQDQFRKEQTEQAQKASSENQRLLEEQTELKREITLLKEQLEKRAEAPTQAAADALFPSEIALPPLPGVAVPDEPPAPRKNLLKRWADWWSEPVTTIALPSKKSDPSSN